MRLSDFDYELPASRIAQSPLAERSASRLLYLPAETTSPDGADGHSSQRDGATLGKDGVGPDAASPQALSRTPFWHDHWIRDLPRILRPGDLLVFNDSRVIPARLMGRKPSGGAVEILFERALSPTRALCLTRASKTPKPGATIDVLPHEQSVRAGPSIGSVPDTPLEGAGRAAIAKLSVIGRHEDLFELELVEGFDDWWALLDAAGEIPLPPYIERDSDASDKARYQTVYAKTPGSVAAPTAGLHFDDELLQELENAGISRCFVTLHVGSGTFLPVRQDDVRQHRMHAEWYQVSREAADLIRAQKARGGRVVAVGTTAMRTLESACDEAGVIRAGSSDTSLFITPGYSFRCVDALITNFHLPKSTLLMLVAAFAGRERILDAYAHAVQAGYRFFSYGDACLLERAIDTHDHAVGRSI